MPFPMDRYYGFKGSRGRFSLVLQMEESFRPTGTVTLPDQGTVRAEVHAFFASTSAKILAFLSRSENTDAMFLLSLFPRR